MSTQSEDKKAWAWYDIDTLLLRHVRFSDDAAHTPGLDKIEIEYETALDIVNGRSRLFEYGLEATDGILQIIYKHRAPPFKKFWQLIDPEASKFDSLFDSTDGNSSPVTITSKTSTGFVVDVRKRAKNIIFYITMKNDPNYLIKKIDLYPYAVDSAATSGIEIPINIQDDYSIYVRYDAA
jgi:hypothetical protein